MRESGFDNIYNLNPKRIRNRRIKVFGLMFLSTLLATAKWVTVIPTDSTVFTKILMVSLFILTFAWIALFFWSSVFGSAGFILDSLSRFGREHFLSVLVDVECPDNNRRQQNKSF